MQNARTEKTRSSEFVVKKLSKRSRRISISVLLAVISSLLSISHAFSGSSSSPSFAARRINSFKAYNSRSDLPSTTTTAMDLSANEMISRWSSNSPLTPSEVEGILQSISNLLPPDNDVDLSKLGPLLITACHHTHKEWDRTLESADALRDILIPGGKEGLSPAFRVLMERCLEEGNWPGAETAAAASSDGTPWAVLVTGVNGIRKTTSVYQSWFGELLEEAMIVPPGKEGAKNRAFPTGRNAFFRQLDHMIAILTNEEFTSLYKQTAALSSTPGSSKEDVIHNYARLKDAIFKRYRTLAEMMGILLIKKAQEETLNVMVETSGRDVAMFHYVDSFFPKKYNKLALHFTINDLSHAEKSVDRRMSKEVQDGIEALEGKSVRDVVYANAGGPYGSEILKGVQRDSDMVWNEKVIGEDSEVGVDWYKATIEIIASDTEDWMARAVKPDGTKGKLHTFAKRK